ncbi:MAG: MFS transporter, partial [Verrucomicrobiia bacterium]
MIRLDGYIVNVALPSMARSLGVGTGGISFVVTSYLLAITGTMLLFGKLADKIGIKRMFMWGCAVFSFASLCCGLSGNLVSLLVSRSLQGLGGAMLLTAAFSSIPRYLPKEINGWAFGLFTLAVGLGISVGAPAGGLIAGLL